MVKNTNGGNKSKGFARKHIVGAKDARSLRLASCELEKYGVIIRILGNGMFYVVTDIADDKQPQLLGHIRNKFKGRSKRDNNIELGSVVLVGLREWENPNYKECDLLEVYDANEVRQLMKTPSIDLSELQRHIDMYSSKSGGTVTSSVEMGDFEFTDERDYTEGLIPDEPCEKYTGPTENEIIDADDL